MKYYLIKFIYIIFFIIYFKDLFNNQDHFFNKINNFVEFINVYYFAQPIPIFINLFDHQIKNDIIVFNHIMFSIGIIFFLFLLKSNYFVILIWIIYIIEQILITKIRILLFYKFNNDIYKILLECIVLLYITIYLMKN